LSTPPKYVCSYNIYCQTMPNDYLRLIWALRFFYRPKIDSPYQTK